MITDAEREQVLEAVADGVLDALRAEGMPHLTLAVKLHIANLARRQVAAKLAETTPIVPPLDTVRAAGERFREAVIDDTTRA